MTSMSDLPEAQNAAIDNLGASPIVGNKANKRRKVDGVLEPRDRELRRESRRVKSLVSPGNSTLGSTGGY